MVIDNDTDFSDAITDNEKFFNSFGSKVKSNKILLIESRDHLIEVLENRQYTKYQIEIFVSQSKFS